jgi:hypothetical protein
VRAVDSFEPYGEILEVNERDSDGLMEIALIFMKRESPAIVYVNKRLAGKTPSTFEAVFQSLAC